MPFQNDDVRAICSSLFMLERDDKVESGDGYRFLKFEISMNKVSSLRSVCGCIIV